MEERRRLWHTILAARRIERRSAAEEAFIRERFPGRDPAGFRIDLSRGFSREHSRALAAICAEHDVAFDPGVWIRQVAKARPAAGEKIEYIGGKIGSSDEFYKLLEERYRDATTYSCVRVGGVFSKNRTRFSYDSDDLALAPEGPSIRMGYLKIFWERVGMGALRGESVHIVKTVDRLVELWASLELLRKKQMTYRNMLCLAPVVRPVAGPDQPAMGVRVVNGSETLLSLPPPPQGDSRYSSWIRANRLAAFAEDYVNRAVQASVNLSVATEPGIRTVMESAFRKLMPRRSDELRHGNYGAIDSFEKLEVVKRRMSDWADGGEWLPVIA